MARFYKTIDSYHLSYQFVLDVYQLTKNFPKSEEQNIAKEEIIIFNNSLCYIGRH